MPHPNEQEVLVISSTWKKLATIDRCIEICPAAARVFTALSLETHARMWEWFSQHVAKPVEYLMGIPLNALLSQTGELEKRMPNKWILPLFRRVQALNLARGEVTLTASDFIEGLEASGYKSAYSLSRKVNHHIESAVYLWLGFSPRPGMSMITSKAVATFTSTLSAAFKSTNFLYLSYVQELTKRNFCLNLTAERTDLTDIPWGKFAKELENHPLARLSSPETVAVKTLKELLWAVSSLPSPEPVPTETAMEYKKAKEIGGHEGAEALANFVDVYRPRSAFIRFCPGNCLRFITTDPWTQERPGCSREKQNHP
jgi:hypothetical protein